MLHRHVSCAGSFAFLSRAELLETIVKERHVLVVYVTVELAAPNVAYGLRVTILLCFASVDHEQLRWLIAFLVEVHQAILRQHAHVLVDVAGTVVRELELLVAKRVADAVLEFQGPLVLDLIDDLSRQNGEDYELVVLCQLLQLLDEALRMLLDESQILLRLEFALVLLYCDIVELVAPVGRIDE